jgi:hypothetical protein
VVAVTATPPSRADRTTHDLRVGVPYRHHPPAAGHAGRHGFDRECRGGPTRQADDHTVGKLGDGVRRRRPLLTIPFRGGPQGILPAPCPQAE